MNTHAQLPINLAATPVRPSMRSPFATVHRKCACGGSCGQEGECAACKRAATLQRSEASGRSEPRLGHDFGRVSLHADPQSPSSAKSTSGPQERAESAASSRATSTPAPIPREQSPSPPELAFVKRQASTEQPTPEKPTNDEGDGYVQGPPEQSALIPKWVANLFPGPDAAAPPKQQTPVSRKPEGDDAQLGSPEQEAMSESPYQTSMSSEQLTTSLQGGQPLGSDVKSSFESRYGHSLSHVRVHTDAKSSSLCNQFGARAFAFRNHIAFGQGMYQPHTSEGTRLLRHELTHVLHDGPRDGGTVKRAALCAGTCPPAGALPWAPLTNTTFNCYSYALNSPASLMLQPGQKSGSSEWTDLHSPDPAKRAAAAATYFTPAGVLRNVTSDLGLPSPQTAIHAAALPNERSSQLQRTPWLLWASAIMTSTGTARTQTDPGLIRGAARRPSVTTPRGHFQFVIHAMPAAATPATTTKT